MFREWCYWDIYTKNNKNVNCTYVDNYEIPLKVTEENIYIHDLKDRSYVVKSDLLEFL